MTDKKKRTVLIALILVGVAVVIGLVIHTQRQNAAVLQADDIATTETSAESEKIVVQVDGAVNKPGVYTLTGDIRGIDAVNAAGGLREDADTSALNLAAKVADGSKLTVPVQGEASTTASSAASDQININTASKEELMQLSGIGEVLAQNIIDYRTENGAFTSTEQIKNVNRIGDKIYEQIKDKIVV